jgi:hypothetical protein
MPRVALWVGRIAASSTPASSEAPGGADVIVGTEARDDIDAKAGNDVICGRGGNDALEAAGGHDRLLGEDGNDTLQAGGGNDTLTGRLGADRFQGGAGRDTATDFNPPRATPRPVWRCSSAVLVGQGRTRRTGEHRPGRSHECPPRATGSTSTKGIDRARADARHERPATDEDPGLRRFVLQAEATQDKCVAAGPRARRQHRPRKYPPS